MRIALLLAACLAALAFVTVAPSAQACTIQYCTLPVCNPFNANELCTVCVQAGTITECRTVYVEYPPCTTRCIE
ncbi:MAG: hypothetical protein QOE90_2183 [Thermoplasmata archaeon]|jgi:hypothetical protein|nr:hypothetical protein [Thermoplasmata archaeon]